MASRIGPPHSLDDDPSTHQPQGRPRYRPPQILSFWIIEAHHIPHQLGIQCNARIPQIRDQLPIFAAGRNAPASDHHPRHPLTNHPSKALTYHLCTISQTCIGLEQERSTSTVYNVTHPHVLSNGKHGCFAHFQFLRSGYSRSFRSQSFRWKDPESRLRRVSCRKHRSSPPQPLNGLYQTSPTDADGN